MKFEKPLFERAENMSDFNLDFDLGEVEAPAEFGVLPAGKHRAVVHEVEVKPDYEGTGKTLWVKITFLDGELKNRKTVSFLDIHSATDWRQTKGRQALVALTEAAGIVGMSNFAELVTETPVGVVVSHYKTKAGQVKDQVRTFIPASDVPSVDVSGEAFDGGDSPF